MDKLQAMEVFVRVVEAGSFVRAADGLHMPKATATTLIQKLEAGLGVKLLNRTTRKLSVTPDGQAYYQRCTAILADVRETEEALSRANASPSGRLRVDVSTLMARLVIIPALPDFFARYPGIRLELGCSDHVPDLVEEHIDCAVVSGELNDQALVARRIGLLHIGTCAAPGYLAAHGRPTHPDDLAGHECINYFSSRSGKTFDWVFAKDTQRIQTPLEGPIALDDANVYLSAAEAGLGIAQVPAFVLKDAIERGTLELVLGEWISEPMPLHVVYPQNRHLSNKVRVFVDWIAALFAEHDGIQLRSTLPQHRPEG
jgi:LysR family transcriptional regulator for bpeEF and oprC